MGRAGLEKIHANNLCIEREGESSQKIILKLPNSIKKSCAFTIHIHYEALFPFLFILSLFFSSWSYLRLFFTIQWVIRGPSMSPKSLQNNFFII